MKICCAACVPGKSVRLIWLPQQQTLQVSKSGSCSASSPFSLLGSSSSAAWVLTQGLGKHSTIFSCAPIARRSLAHEFVPLIKHRMKLYWPPRKNRFFHLASSCNLFVCAPQTYRSHGTRRPIVWRVT